MSTALPLTPEQRLLADSAARFFRDRGAPAAGTRESWQTMADLGWFGVAVPEDLGGLGAGMLEQSIIMMAAAEALSPLPLLMAGVFAPQLLLALRDNSDVPPLLEKAITGEATFTVAFQDQSAVLDPRRSSASLHVEGGALILSGSKPFVFEAGFADMVIVPCEVKDPVSRTQDFAIVAVPVATNGVHLKPVGSFAGTDVGTIEFTNVRLSERQVLARGWAAMHGMEFALSRTVAGLCAALAGIGRVLMDDTSAYVKVREQFGQPIGSFQALQHRLADMHIALEEAVSLAWMAALAADNTDYATRGEMVSAARIGVCDRVLLIAREAVQLHGGMGMTEELRVGPAFRLVKALELMVGDREYFVSILGSLQPGGGLIR